MWCGEGVGEELQRATKRFLLRIVFAWSLSYWSFTRLFSVREVAAKIITALKAMTRPYAKCHIRPAPPPAPHRLARVQCSLCALLVSIAKSCVLEVCCCPPYTNLHSCLPLPQSPQLCPAALCGISCTCFSYQKMQDSCKIYLKCWTHWELVMKGNEGKGEGGGGVPSVDCTHFMALGF